MAVIAEGEDLMTERGWIYVLAIGCALFWAGVAAETYTGRPLLELLGVW